MSQARKGRGRVGGVRVQHGVRLLRLKCLAVDPATATPAAHARWREFGDDPREGLGIQDVEHPHRRRPWGTW